MPLPTGRALLDPNYILSQARMSAGMRYADFGSGTIGHFVLPAAAIAGPGTQVYAVDILKSALDGVDGRARLEQIGNVVTVWGNVEKIGGVNIPEDSLDLISMVNITSLIIKSPETIEEIKRLLNTDGKLLLVDWKPDIYSAIAPPKEERASPDDIRSVLEKAEMVVMKEFDAGVNHWGLLVRHKPFQEYPIKEVG